MTDPRSTHATHLAHAIAEAERIVLQIESLFPVNTFSIKARGIESIRTEYHHRILAAVSDYLASHDRSTAYKSDYKQAATEAIPEAFYAGYEDAGGDRGDVDPDADQWLTARMNQEMDFIDQLFVSLKQLRDDFAAGDAKAGDLRSEAANRADGYSATIEAIYNAGSMWGNKNQMLTWHYGDTEHCDTCNGLNGDSHRAKWYLSRDYIPRKPGAAMDCGGYHCQCWLEDSGGNAVTIQ